MGRSWEAPPDPDALAAELDAMQRGRAYDAKTGGQRARWGYVLDCGHRIAISGPQLPATQLTLFCRVHRVHRRILDFAGRLPDRPAPAHVEAPAWTARSGGRRA